MGSAIEIRQMMAEGKLSIAQFEIEASLKTAHAEERRELLCLVLELLKLDQKLLPAKVLLEAVSMTAKNSKEVFRELLPLFESDHRINNLLEFQLLRIKSFEERGKLQEMLSAISEFQIYCVENKLPILNQEILEFSRKYFRHEFSLALQRISLALMLKDSETVCSEVRSLLLELSETRTRNSLVKVQALLDILGSFELQGMEILYRNYCQLRLKGISEARDYKTILELVIGLEDFPMLVLVLDLASGSLPEAALQEFAGLLRSLPDYDFIYLDKNFPKLKSLFVSMDSGESLQENNIQEFITEEDLKLDEDELTNEETRTSLVPPMEDEEVNLLKQIQYGEFTFNALCDLTVSFLQSDYLRAARNAIMKAADLARSEEETLRALYLRITVLMKLRDYRSALDQSLRAMDLVSSEDDLLSLLYVQAECQEKLQSKGEAKKILQRILDIDGEYRLAKERLDKLNEA